MSDARGGQDLPGAGVAGSHTPAPVVADGKAHAPNRLDGLHRLGGRQVHVGLLQSSLQQTTQQQRQGSHEDVRLDPPRISMVDRPHRDHVFQLPEAAFHVAQLLVVGHRVQGDEVFLAGDQDVLALQTQLRRHSKNSNLPSWYRQL